MRFRKELQWGRWLINEIVDDGRSVSFTGRYWEDVRNEWVTATETTNGPLSTGELRRLAQQQVEIGNVLSVDEEFPLPDTGWDVRQAAYINGALF